MLIVSAISLGPTTMRETGRTPSVLRLPHRDTTAAPAEVMTSSSDLGSGSGSTGWLAAAGVAAGGAVDEAPSEPHHRASRLTWTRSSTAQRRTRRFVL